MLSSASRLCVVVLLSTLFWACDESPLGDGFSDGGSSLQCGACHGSDENAAPPAAISRDETEAALVVGAHQSHVRDGLVRLAVPCSECHVVPTSVSAPGHVDAAPAEVVFGTLATRAGAEPVWGRVAATCSSTYCHGTTLEGGGLTEPVWTVVDGSQAQCDSCHGIPPPPPHPAATFCRTCHARTVAEDGSILLVEAQHIDGEVDLDASSCDACHGSDGNPAPPVDTQGLSSTDLVSVGAHRQHLQPSDWHRQVRCDDCHKVPVRLGDPGHIDSDLPAEVVFTDVGTGFGEAAPVWNGVSCEQAFCHGGTLEPGGTLTDPVWTQLGTEASECGACHSTPPGGEHEQRDDCVACHALVVDADRNFVNPALHIDGIVQAFPGHDPGWEAPDQHGKVFNDSGLDECAPCHGEDLLGGVVQVSCDGCHKEYSADWTTDCLFCHGRTDNQTGAPPEGVDGETARNLLVVGAHSMHVQQTLTHVAWDCGRCHIKPDSIVSPGHIDGDGVAEVRFDALNPTATSSATGSCANNYCHGNGWNRLGTAAWPADLQLGCGDCHGYRGNMRSASGEHHKHVDDERFACVECHQQTVDATDRIVGLALHVNGKAEVRLAKGGTVSAAGTMQIGCAPSCHENFEYERWF